MNYLISFLFYHYFDMITPLYCYYSLIHFLDYYLSMVKYLYFALSCSFLVKMIIDDGLMECACWCDTFSALIRFKSTFLPLFGDTLIRCFFVLLLVDIIHVRSQFKHRTNYQVNQLVRYIVSTLRPFLYLSRVFYLKEHLLFIILSSFSF